MAGDGSGSEWEKYGAIDPYFAVVNHEAYRGTRLPAGARDQFFASGKEHVASVMADVRAHIDPAFAPRRGLDFGCGVGRLTIPLARVCGSIVGVDIAASMLAEARENGREFGITNMELRQSSADLAYPLMAMNEYDLNRLFVMIQDAGCDRSFIRFTNHGGHLGVVLYFQLGVPSVG